MPVIFEKEINATKKLAVWQITEPLDFFLDKLGRKFNPNQTEKRQLENACSTLLLNYTSGNIYQDLLKKDEFGKPYLEDMKASLSFSHSRDMVACLFDSEGGPVGVDIEEARDRISAIAPKFLNGEDCTPFSGTRHFHLVWGAKEVLYKIYSRKELDFKSHLTVSFREKFEGFIHKNEFKNTYGLDFLELNNFILVWNV